MFPTTPTILSVLALGFLHPVLAADYDFSVTLPIGSLTDDQKNDWCKRNVETCDQVCGKEGTSDQDGKPIDNGGTKKNICIYTTLEYSCYCNKTDPNDNTRFMHIHMEKFHYSVPGLMCEASWDLCRQNFKDDKDKLQECKDKIFNKCGRNFTRQQWGFDQKLAHAWKQKFGKREDTSRREVAFEA